MNCANALKLPKHEHTLGNVWGGVMMLHGSTSCPVGARVAFEFAVTKGPPILPFNWDPMPN